MTDTLITADSIARAAADLSGIATRTPLVPAWWAREALGADVRLKCENLQRTGAFKFRGAYTFISRLSDRERQRGVITYSSGNHAHAVAFAARLFAIPAVIVMPTTAMPVKIEAARQHGAEIVFEGTTFRERQVRARAIGETRGLTEVPPFDHPDIIAGQGTIGREILDQWPEVEAIVVPAGGGGEVSGVGAWVKRAKPSCRVIGVQPERSAAIRRSLDAGAIVSIDSTATMADGLRIERPGVLTFAHIRAFADEVVTVSESAIEETTRRLILESKLLVEFSGATALAAVLSGRWLPEGRPTAVVLSGGNIDPATVAELIVRHAPAAV